MWNGVRSGLWTNAAILWCDMTLCVVFIIKFSAKLGSAVSFPVEKDERMMVLFESHASTKLEQ